MRNKLLTTVLAVMLMLTAAACGSSNEGGAPQPAESPNAEQPADGGIAEENDSEPKGDGTQTITYLDNEYTLPEKVERIVITGAMEAMEDALVLDVKPVGAITFAGEFPERFDPIVSEAESIGEKTQPDFETILKLKPDVILASTKFPEEVVQQLEKIATTIRVSHIATHWEDNLFLLAELSGKQELARQEIEQYRSGLEQAKEQLGENLDGKSVLAVRIRSGQMYIYPEAVFFNPILYEDLGFSVPAEVQAAKAQELISVEALADMNPDVLFIQYAEAENADAPNVVEELQNNPIIRNISALKNDQAFVNLIDPLAEGGPAWSRIHFVKEAVEHLTE